MLDDNAVIRKSIVDGIFYPGSRDELKSTLETHLAESPVNQGDAFFIIVPHAAYRYAGRIVASAFKSASLRPVKTVVVIAPGHGDLEEAIYLPESTAFRTPLGDISVNTDLVEQFMRTSDYVIRSEIPHKEEHCIEVQLPFIQHLFPEADFVPVLLGNQTMRMVKSLANVLQLTLTKMYDYILTVASSNNASSTQGKSGIEGSHIFTELILNRDWRSICDAITTRKTSACGAGCVASVLASVEMSFDMKVVEMGESAIVDENKKENMFYVAYSAEIKGD